MVSMLQPVRFESCPLVSRTAREIVSSGMRKPLEPVGTTGPMLSLVMMNRDTKSAMSAHLKSITRRPAPGAAANQQSVDGSGKREGLLAAGGVIGAIAASSCCILPLVLFTLGISGAWIGNLTALAPYQPIFLV